MMLDSVKKAFNDSVEAIATSEPLFELEQREIRGVEFMTFRNGPKTCLLYTSPSPRDEKVSRMPSSA